MKTIVAVFAVVVASFLEAPLLAQVMVIANPSVKAVTASKTDLREVFCGGASSLSDGSRVTPVLLKAGPTEDEFVATFVGKSDTAFRAGWRSLVFSGQATMPKSLDSDASVVDFVARTPGSIGYINKAVPHEGVKVLIVK